MDHESHSMCVLISRLDYIFTQDITPCFMTHFEKSKKMESEFRARQGVECEFYNKVSFQNLPPICNRHHNHFDILFFLHKRLAITVVDFNNICISCQYKFSYLQKMLIDLGLILLLHWHILFEELHHKRMRFTFDGILYH